MATITAGAAGTLDRSFSGDGRITTAVAGLYNLFNPLLALQPDGRIILASSGADATDRDYHVLRYTAAGVLDTSFGTGGRATAHIGDWDSVGGVVVTPAGKIVVAGDTSSGSYSDFGVVRFNSNGTLDTTFGTGGKVRTSLDPLNDVIWGMALQQDGKVVVSGYASFDLALVRYNTNGTLDGTFDGDGRVINTAGYGIGHTTVVQPDGKIVVAFSGYSADDYAVMRFNANGTVDTGFGTNGINSITIGPDFGRVEDVALQPDGKILVAGMVYVSSSERDYGLVRYNANGTLDTTFGGGDGWVMTRLGTRSDSGSSVAVLPDGRILVAGTSQDAAGDYFMAVVCYKADGSVDTAFSGDGKLVLPIEVAIGSQVDILVQPDGRAVISGSGTGVGTVELARFFTGANELTGTASADSITGAGGQDTLVGGGGNDTLNGAGGNDRLFGGAGLDMLIGGSGNDTYIITAAGDTIREALNAGSDTVLSSIGYTLGSNVEHLTLRGVSAINGFGNGIANVLTGNDAANTLDGRGGADRLFGGSGNDVLVWDPLDPVINGGAGMADTLRVIGAGKTLNLLSYGSAKILNIEIIDIAGGGNNRLELSAQDVLDLSSTTNTLRVDGNAGDVVDRNAGWTEGANPVIIGANTYFAYTQGGATLLVDSDITSVA